MERIGIYGGSFNPPHIGHIQGAREAVSALGLTKVLLVPAGIAPHKPNQAPSVSPEDRLAMLRLAARDCPEFLVSDLEIRRQGVSYSYETVAQLRQQYPEAELVFVMGTDMFLSFETWKNWEQILKQVTLGVLFRGDPDEQDRVSSQKAELEALGGRVLLAKNEVRAISSTQLRRLLAFGSHREFLPQGVGEYILDHGLYDTRADWKNLPMEELEPIVCRLLKKNRVAHVLGVRDTAVKLARRWGADETDAARAGILHDITKALDGPLQLTLCRAYGTILDTFSTENPKTLHALTGSLVAEKIFGENPAVVAAIRSHTAGVPHMNLLQKIVYVADYMEPNRDFPGVERLRELAFTDLDGALQLGLEMTIGMLTEQKREISRASLDTLAWLKESKHTAS